MGYQARGQGLALSATGAVTVGDVLVNESDTGDRFLSWKTLSTDDLTFTLAPNRLRIKEIRVTEPGAKVVIAKDRSLNLVHVLRGEADPTAPVATPDGLARSGRCGTRPQAPRAQVSPSTRGLPASACATARWTSRI